MKEKRQIVEFIQITNGVRSKTSGIAVGRVLAVAFTSKFDETTVQIFNVLTGKPIVNIRFSSKKDGINDAVKVAKWLDEVYGDYLEVPTAKGFENADVIDICQWTIPNGIQIRLAFNLLEKAHNQVEHMTAGYVAKAYELAAPEVEKYNGFMRPR